MKKNVITLLLTIGSTSLFAQGPWLTTGNAIAPANFLGTVNAQPLNFRTNNIQRMTLQNNTGRLAIGLNFNTPVSLLHLNSNGYGTGEVFRTTAPAGVSAWRLETGATEKFNVTAVGNDAILGAIQSGNLGFVTNNIGRMNITSTGLVGVGLNFTTATSLLHVNEFSYGTGKIFRADGISTVQNDLEIFTGTIATALTPKFRIAVLPDGVDINHDNEVRLGTVANEQMHFTTNNTTRVTIDGGGPLSVTRGYVGFNHANPDFHLDIRTPERATGELLIRTRVLGDTTAYMANINMAGAGTLQYTPAWMGKASAINPAPAFNTIGSIETAQDVGGLQAVSRFVSATDYDPSVGDFTLLRVNVLTNRPIFQWQNAVDRLMLMEASGFLGLATTNPGNRLEINSDFYGAAGVPLTVAQQRHFNTSNGNPGLGEGNATGFSGLRFTDLRSGSVPLATNPGNGVLSVDANGDVIYVPGGGSDDQTLSGSITGNTLNLTISEGNTINLALPASPMAAENGTSVNTAGKVVLGQDYGQVGNPAILLNDREIPLDTNEINFSGPGTLHISQGSSNLNTNAALDINTTLNTSGFGLLIKDSQASAPAKKGIFVDMTFNSDNTQYAGIQIGDEVNSASGTSTPCVEKSWLLKTYGDQHYTKTALETEKRVAFGVEATGRIGINSPQCDYRFATMTIQDHFNNPDLGNPYYVTSTGLESVFKPQSRALLINSINTTNSIRKTGIEVYSQNNSGFSTGIFAVGDGSSTNPDSNNSGFGVIGIGKSNAANRTDPVAAGVRGFGLAFNTVGTAYGVEGYANGATLRNYGIYGRVDQPSNPVYFAGYFEGNVRINGQLYLNGNFEGVGANNYASDQNLKTNVDTISNALGIIHNLNPRQFYFDTINNHGFSFGSEKQYGFIAQEVESILPDLVHDVVKSPGYDSLGTEITPAFAYKSLNYNAFIGILTKAVQEQQQEIDAQQTELDAKDSVIASLQNQLAAQDSRLAAIENCLSALNLCEMNQQAVQQTPQEIQQQLKQKISVTLSDRNTIVLNQNVPNPFAESTVIEYSIPNNVQQAQIHFYDANGKLIQSVNLTERGKGELTVFASDLSSGIYTYSLVTDGKIVSTKKMMKN